MRLAVTLLACFLTAPLFADDGNTVLLADLCDHAMQQSQITLPGGKPFHLKANIAEKDSPDSDYQATVEEYWVSPTKWRRTITSPDFSQTLVTNGEAVFEEDKGDYYPVWLNNFVTAIFDPLPMIEQLRQAGVRATKRDLSGNETSCTNLPMRVDRWVLCFMGKNALLSSVFTKGYAAQFDDFKGFADKQVPRLIENSPESGTTIDARITELTELREPDESLFVVEQSTQPKDRIKSVRVDQDVFMKLALTSTEIEWPPQGGGPTTGGCAVFVGVDRAGKVRESWPGGCDSTGIGTALRDIVKTWKLRAPLSNGVPVQVEALLGFTFHTEVYENPDQNPTLSAADMKRQTISCKPSEISRGLLPKGTVVPIRVSVDEKGNIIGLGPVGRCPVGCGLLAGPIISIRNCKFAPLTVNGRAVPYKGDVELVAP